MLSTTLLLAALTLTQASQCADVCGHEAVRLYGALLAKSGLGRRDAVEHAAFVILRNGALTVEGWPAGDRNHVSFKGLVPEDSIAIVHTHPTSSPDPSRLDAEVARKFGMPVVVLTVQSMSMVDPVDGKTKRVYTKPGWWLKAGN